MVIKVTSSTSPNIEAVYFYIVLVLMKSHAGGNQGGMRNYELIWSDLKAMSATELIYALATKLDSFSW